MTITPFKGIAVIDVENNMYLLEAKGMYYEGMGLGRAMLLVEKYAKVEAAIHTIKFLDATELEEMKELVGEDHIFGEAIDLGIEHDMNDVQTIEKQAIMLL